MNYNKKSIQFHKKHRGKIEIKSKVPLKTSEDLSLAYTPGVAAVSSAVGKNKKLSWELTNRANQVAIVTDGTAILGLGNLGPEAAMPVMEGKAIIFKEFANVDAIPLCVSTTDVDEIVKFCKLVEPSFGGINLEDISAPRCFEVLRRLEKELSIPVFHDDQDGTAIVVLAALINACRVRNLIPPTPPYKGGKNPPTPPLYKGGTLKSPYTPRLAKAMAKRAFIKGAFENLKIVISGAGAAGIAAARLLVSQGIKDIILVDSRGAIYQGRKHLNPVKSEIAVKTNKRKIKGGLQEAMAGTDVFIGVSAPGIVSEATIKSMNKNPIIFAMANPIPEIMPNKAYRAGAFIVGTGRSDFKNQINNALVFPGLFRGLLDGKIRKVTVKIKVAAAIALAYSIKPTKNKLLPLMTDKKVVKAIAKAVTGSKK